jgi:hypothetical protein
VADSGKVLNIGIDAIKFEGFIAEEVLPARTGISEYSRLLAKDIMSYQSRISIKK